MRLYNIRQAQISADNVYKVGVKTDDERVYPDGTREAVELGRQCEAEPGEVVRLEQRLPDDLKPTWFCMRASQQDMYVYVDGELRKDYSTKNTRLFGKNSASAYVFFEIKEEDAGSMLAVENISESEYAGYLNEMYKGDKLDIAKVLVQECFGVLIISILMLMISFFYYCDGRRAAYSLQKEDTAYLSWHWNLSVVHDNADSLSVFGIYQYGSEESLRAGLQYSIGQCCLESGGLNYLTCGCNR